MAESSTHRSPFRVNLLRAHGSPSRYLYQYRDCRCTACRGAAKDYSAAQYRKHREKKLAYQRGYAAEHLAENTAYWKRYRVERREEMTEYFSAYYAENRARYAAQRANRREEIALYNAEWRVRNPGYHNVYRAEHREMCLAKEHRRRALKRGNGGTHTAADISSQFTRQKGLCFYCHEKLLAYHVDHVMPLVRGGSNGPENLVIACPSCNMRKNARHPMDFAGVLF